MSQQKSEQKHYKLRQKLTNIGASDFWVNRLRKSMAFCHSLTSLCISLYFLSLSGSLIFALSFIFRVIIISFHSTHIHLQPLQFFCLSFVHSEPFFPFLLIQALGICLFLALVFCLGDEKYLHTQPALILSQSSQKYVGGNNPNLTLSSSSFPLAIP